MRSVFRSVRFFMLFFNPSSCASNLKEGNIIECIYIELFKRRVIVPRLKGMLHIEKKNGCTTTIMVESRSLWLDLVGSKFQIYFTFNVQFICQPSMTESSSCYLIEM